MIKSACLYLIRENNAIQILLSFECCIIYVYTKSLLINYFNVKEMCRLIVQHITL